MSYKEKPQIKLFRYTQNAFKLIAIIDDCMECSWERNLYEAGQFTISINYNIPNSHLFDKGLFVQFGDDVYDFGLITKIQDNIDQNGKGGQIRNITGFDARYIFKSRVIKNLNSNGNWELTSKAEICLRSLIDYQCGSQAENKRKLPIVNTIPSAENALGNEYTVSESFSNLYDVCRTIATQGGIGWRLRFEDGELSLECYEGTDRSSSVQFSPSFDSLRDGNFTDSSESLVNSVYIGGKGNNSERDIYEGESLIDSESPGGFDRFESFDNQSQLTTEDEYKNQADSILTQYAQTLSMSGNGLAVCPYIYKEQYDVGDKIKFSFSNKTANVQILSVTEHWSWNNYEINFSFGKPENTLKDQLQLILRKIQKASNKTNATESVKWYEVPDDNAMNSDDVTFDTIGFTGDVGTGFTFRLYLDGQKTGSKNYNIYFKNLTGTGKLTLTTGIAGASNVELSAVDYVGMIFVDTEGNITSVSASHANTADSATTAQTAATAQTAETATNAENASIAKTSRMNDIIIAGNTLTQYAMTLTIPGFTAADLVTGKTIKVLFNRNNTSSNPTININSLGAHAMKVMQSGSKINVPRHYGKWRGATSNSYERWPDGTILELMYDGTYWVIVGNPMLENYNDSAGGGYTVYADGFIEQWGTYTGRGVNNITFPISHSYTPHLSFCGNININSSAIWSALGYNVGTNGFTVNWNADNTFLWSVHGY